MYAFTSRSQENSFRSSLFGFGNCLCLHLHFEIFCVAIAIVVEREATQHWSVDVCLCFAMADDTMQRPRLLACPLTHSHPNRNCLGFHFCCYLIWFLLLFVYDKRHFWFDDQLFIIYCDFGVVFMYTQIGTKGWGCCNAYNLLSTHTHEVKKKWACWLGGVSNGQSLSSFKPFFFLLLHFIDMIVPTVCLFTFV